MTKKYKKPLVCKICGKKFSYSAKTHPLARLNKHRWKEHPTQAKKALKKKPKKSQITSELELADDLLLRQIQTMKQQYAPTQQYDSQHNIAVGALIEGVMLGIELVKATKSGVERIKKAKKK